MDLPTGAGFLTGVVGGIVASAANWLFSADARRKTRQETNQIREQIDGIKAGIGKTNAETEKIQAETEKTKAETLLLMKPQPRVASTDVWGEPPSGWLAGNIEGASDDYVVGIDQVQGRSGKASAYQRAKSDEPDGFGALSQRFRAGVFSGKRLGLAGYLRVQSVEGWAGLWMRI